MAEEDPNLIGLNNAASEDPTSERVETQKIKSDEKVVGGVHLGAIDAVELTGEDQAKIIDNAVTKAISFKPTFTREPAVISAANQIRQDFLGINTWLNARARAAAQVDRLLAQGVGGDPGTSINRASNVNAILMQRTIELRLQEANRLQEQQLSVSKNILGFNVETSTTFMRNSLALQYRQLFATKDLITITKAFADMAENKLEAIKINTKLPEVKKETLLDTVKKQIYKKAVTSAGKAAVEFLSHESLDDVKNSVNNARAKISDLIGKARNLTLSVASKKQAGPKVSFSDQVKSALQPDAVWKTTQVPREIIADMIKHSTTKKSPEALLSSILTEITQQNAMTRGGTPGGQPIERPGVPIAGGSFAIASEFASMNKSLAAIYGSFDAYRASYEKNVTKQESNFERLYALIGHIATTLQEGKFGGGSGTSNTAAASEIEDLLEAIKNKAGIDTRTKTHKISDAIVSGAGSILKGTGSAIGMLPRIYKSYLGFGAGAVKATANVLFRKRDKSPYADVYLAGNIKPGHPLVSEKRFRKGLVFADGSRVLNVNKINQPVLDPVTGETLITEDDLKTGIVDVFGKPITKRSASFSLLPGVFDLAKFGIKTAGTVVKPILNIYAEIIKTIPKAMVGIGGFISKSLIGILSGKAPGALAKGLMGITGTFAKMYANMFSFGIKSIGSIGGTLFGRLLGLQGRGGFKKKDIYDLITVRLDNIYSLLNERLVNNNIRSGSFQDHEAREKRDEENLVHLRNEEETKPGSGGILGRLASLMGIGGAAAGGSAISDPDSGDGVDSPNKNADGDDTSNNNSSSGSGGILNDIKTGAEGLGGIAIAKKLSRFVPNLKTPGKILKGVGSIGKGTYKLGKGAAEAAADIASDASKFASKTALKDVLVKLGGKSIAKAIPGFGALAGTAFAVNDIRHKDYTAAVGDEASGLVSMVPYIGTSAGLAIDGWLAYRQFHKAGTGGSTNFFKTRLKSYGLDDSSSKIVTDLEARTLQVVISKGKDKFSDSELADYAKRFGFNPKNRSQFQYFCGWLDNRFRDCYLMYLTVLRKYNYSLVAGDSAVREKDQAKLISEYISDVSDTIQKYSALIPTMIAYKASPAGIAAQQLASPPTDDSDQQATQQTTPTNSVKPNSLPIIQASYNTSSVNNYNGLAQTQELTYTPTNDNAPARPTVPGMPSGPSAMGNMIAAGQSWNSIVPGTVNSAPAQPISSALTKQRAIQAVNYFMKCGWTKEQACGIVGSLMRESQLNTTAVGDGGNALGIAQWHSDRYGPILQTLYPGKTMQQLTFEEQLAAVQWELNGPEQRAAQMLKSAKDPRTAGAYASKYYERPANTNGEMAVRAGIAAGVYAAYTGNPASANQQLASAAPPPSTAAVSPTDSATDLTAQPSIQTASIIQPAGDQESSNFNGGRDNGTVISQQTTYPVMPASTMEQPTAPGMVSSPYGTPSIQNAAYQMPRYFGQGPGSAIMDPIRTAAMDIANIKNTFAAFKNLGKGGEGGFPQQPLSVQVTPHPDMIAAAQEQSVASKSSLSILGDISASLSGLHKHLQDVHGPNGLFGTMADNIATQAQQPAGSSVFAPVISVPQKQAECDGNVGFGVRKKRTDRYAA